MSVDFYRLIEAIDSNRLIIIDNIDYIDRRPMIDFLRLGTPGIVTFVILFYFFHNRENMALLLLLSGKI